MTVKHLFLIASLSLSVGCAKMISDSVKTITGDKEDAPPATKEARSCVPEKELLVSGIVGGTVVKKSDADSKTAVLVVSGNQLCTATAITSDILLTAAHCVKDIEASEAYMFTSSTVSCESGFDSRRDRITVRKIVMHPDYQVDLNTDEYSTNDLALVILSKKLPASYPIFKLASPDVAASSSALYFWGFGEVNNGRGGDGQLRKTAVTSSEYEIVPARKKVTVNQSGGHGICHGDSGGPAFVNEGSELKLLAVNSYVEGSSEASLCKGDSYLTLISSYKDWLQSELAKLGETLK